MKASAILLLIILISCPAWAEQTIDHGGRTILSFDVPQVEYRSTKEGKVTRTFFSNKVGDGNLKITAITKGWLSGAKAEERFRDDKRDQRLSQDARLHDPIELPGALKTLTYSTESPYVAEVVVVYTEDYRCEILVTGTNQAAEQLQPTYQQLLKTLKVIRKNKIGELQIGD
jgi:hypothetical protein